MNILSKVTLKNLKKNKTRTIVTIIGIILSVSMFTAVTTIISSMQNYLVEAVKESTGSYHCLALNVEPEKLEELDNNTDLEGYSSLRSIGYAKINSKNEFKPYLFVAGINNNFNKYVPIKLISGEMPKKANEIILPEHLKSNGGVKYKKGDSITLEIGERISGKEHLDQNIDFNVDEKLITTEKKTYTVVGFYERPKFEKYSAPGYTALTIDDKNSDKSYDVFFAAAKMSNIYDVAEKYFENYELNYNNDLLRFNGISNFNGFNIVLYGFAGVLIFIIMLGSISLIYNAFSISVSERTKQFGLLKSIGATKRQILRSVIFEALFLSIIGIPIGVLAGIGGIGITFYFIGDYFDLMLTTDTAVKLSLYVSWTAVIIACIIGIITVLISSYIPARRAAKKQAIESIKQSNDIKIKAKKLRTSKLTYKLFGFSGMLAKKNFKRNNKKYRATVISLFMSIVLFMTATTFSAYLSSSANDLVNTKSFDICAFPNETSEKSILKAEKVLNNIDGIDKHNKVLIAQPYLCTVDKKTLDESYLKAGYYNDVKGTNNNAKSISLYISFIQNDVYKKFLKDNHFDEKIYMDKNNPVALFKNEFTCYDSNKQQYVKTKVFKNEGAAANLSFLKEIDGYYLNEENYDKSTKKHTFTYEKDDSREKKTFDSSEVLYGNKKIKIGAFIDNKTLPMGADYYGNTLPFMIVPEMYKDIIFKNASEADCLTGFLFFKAKNYNAVYDKMEKAILQADIENVNLNNYAKELEIANSLVLIINIFTYGFIILISLIAIANVFNTISTNISLRRREFAMLKSVGMTQKAFNKMMNYECVLYGVKSLIYGLPVGLTISLILGRILQEAYRMGYIFPWQSMIIVVLSVFAVVFITMLYSMSKIKKDNPIEALKNENI